MFATRLYVTTHCGNGWRSSGLWRSVVLRFNTSASKDHAASTFKVKSQPRTPGLEYLPSWNLKTRVTNFYICHEIQTGSVAQVRVPVTLQLTVSQSVSQSVRPSWRRAPFATDEHVLICCETIVGLVFMGVLCDEKTGLPLVVLYVSVVTRKIKLYNLQNIYNLWYI
jgi:hypothetical protein